MANVESLRARRLGLICVALAAVALSACSDHSPPDTSARRAVQKRVRSSPRLRLSIDPPVGEPGTRVSVTVTGCNDPSGRNHAVSFNNNALEPSARNDANLVREIRTSQRGQTLTGIYTIRDDDRTGGVGMVFAQCAADIKQAAFVIPAASP